MRLYMQRVDTARQVAVADMVDLHQALLLVAADTVDRPAVMVALPADLRQVVDTADLRKARPPADTAAADSVSRPEVTAADSVRPVVDSRLPEDPWVREWATTSTRPSR